MSRHPLYHLFDVYALNIEDLLDTASVWQRVDKRSAHKPDVVAALTRSGDFNDFVYEPMFEVEVQRDRYLTHSDLAQIHQDLPRAMHARMHNDNRVDRSEIALMRDFFQKGAVAFPEEAYLFESASRPVIKNIKRVEIMDANCALPYVQCECTVYVLATSQEGLSYPESTNVIDIVLDKDWVDRYYPGWQTRLESALALGLTDEECAEHALSVLPGATMVGTLPEFALCTETTGIHGS